MTEKNHLFIFFVLWYGCGGLEGYGVDLPSWEVKWRFRDLGGGGNYGREPTQTSHRVSSTLEVLIPPDRGRSQCQNYVGGDQFFRLTLVTKSGDDLLPGSLRSRMVNTSPSDPDGFYLPSFWELSYPRSSFRDRLPSVRPLFEPQSVVTSRRSSPLEQRGPSLLFVFVFSLIPFRKSLRSTSH